MIIIWIGIKTYLVSNDRIVNNDRSAFKRLGKFLNLLDKEAI